MSLVLQSVPPRHEKEDPLWHTRRELVGVSRVARYGLFAPVPLTALGYGGISWFDPRWMHNPVLLLILAIFTVGQVMLFRHLQIIRRGSQRALETIDVLQEAGRDPDLATLRDTLRRVRDSHTRDLVLRWVELGLTGHTEGADTLLENASERRAIRDQKLASVHISINRTILKVGFMGTLVGLLLTFPPMKRAVLGLSASNGELGFIRDIAMAIDEDAYAIMATLISTGFSILLETVVVQALERMITSFDIADRHLADWNVTVLQPAIFRNRDLMESRSSLSPVHLGGTREEMDAQFALLLETIQRNGQTVEALALAQAAIAARVEELVRFEGSYREFLVSKAAALTPETARQAQ